MDTLRLHFLWFFLVIFIAGCSLYSCNPNNQKITEISNRQPESTKREADSETHSSHANNPAKDDRNLEATANLASQFYVSGDYEKAIFHFFRILETDRNNLFAIINIGNIYYDTHHYEKAIEFYERALELDHTNLDVKCDMATCYFSLNLPEKAIRILKSITDTDFSHAQAHHNLSVIYRQIGKIREAEEEMKIYQQLSAR